MTAPLGVVVNPIHARARPALAAVRAVARELGEPAPIVRETRVDAPGGPQAAELAPVCRRVLVVGGDGTLRDVAGALAGTGVVLGLVPTGSGNIAARNLAVPLGRPRLAARRAAIGRPRPLALGWARVGGADGAAVRAAEPFLVMAGLGHDAATVAATSRRAKRLLRSLAYAVPALRTAGRAPVPVRVTLGREGSGPETWGGGAWTVLAGLMPAVPGGIVVFPAARPGDGEFSVLTVTDSSAAAWLRAARFGLTARRGGSPPGSLRYDRARTIRVEADEPLLAQLDGEVRGPTRRLELTLAPRALAVAGPVPRRADRAPAPW